MPRQAYTRRDFMKLGVSLAALTAAGSFSACGKRVPLKIAIQPWCGYQFIFLAELEGWLPKEGLKLIKTTIASESVKLLKQGLADGAALTLDEVLLLRDQGMDLSVVAILDISAGADVLLAKPAIQQWSDVKGKRIGVETTSLGAVMLSKFLDAAGLQRADVTVVPIDENHIAAWENNHLDIIQAYEPTLSQLQAKGLVPIFDSRSMPQTILDVLAVRTDVAERYADTLRGLVAGHFNALKLWRHNPFDAESHLSILLGVKPEEVKSVYQGLDLPDALYNGEYLYPPATLLNQSATDVARIMTQEGMLKRPLKFDNLFVADYLPGANE